ncbi:hypothetical protein [Akkermansia glycaniphila]|nr:hypothetical protein [Akkermansia glycaniphila]OCA03052.1 hypothetical protein AC781_06690 [Akkermansia glycaniphila]
MESINQYLASLQHLQEKDEDGQSLQNTLEGDLLQMKQNIEKQTLAYGRILEVVLLDEWNNSELVRSIGEMPWEIVLAQWNLLKASLIGPEKEKMDKFVLVKLRNRNQDEAEKKEKMKKGEAVSEFSSYAGWTEMISASQEGFMWGVEIEGGDINVYLKEKYRYKPKREPKTIENQNRKFFLKEKLSYLKRTPLLQTNYGYLAIDNVMDDKKVEGLLTGNLVPIPLEIASKPISGELDSESRKVIRMLENRKKETWPAVKMDRANSQLQVPSDKYTPIALEKFNEIFLTKFVNNISMHTMPQHATKSGKSENRLTMAEELVKTACAFKPGTSGKVALSKMPKTSIELLRHAFMSGEEVRRMEGYAGQVREQLLKKLGKDTKFADDHLNAIIIPASGVPREIGGYTLLTPMTNALPLIRLGREGKKEVTVLRENRELTP